MKKKIFVLAISMVLFMALSFTFLKTAEASIKINPTELCHTWCWHQDYQTCVLHAGDENGTYIITCWHMVWP